MRSGTTGGCVTMEDALGIVAEHNTFPAFLAIARAAAWLATPEGQAALAEDYAAALSALDGAVEGLVEGVSGGVE